MGVYVQTSFGFFEGVVLFGDKGTIDRFRRGLIVLVAGLVS